MPLMSILDTFSKTLLFLILIFIEPFLPFSNSEWCESKQIEIFTPSFGLMLNFKICGSVSNQLVIKWTIKFYFRKKLEINFLSFIASLLPPKIIIIVSIEEKWAIRISDTVNFRKMLIDGHKWPLSRGEHARNEVALPASLWNE